MFVRFCNHLLAILRSVIAPLASLYTVIVILNMIEVTSSTVGFIVLLYSVVILILLLFLALLLFKMHNYCFDADVFEKFITYNTENKKAVVKFCKENQINSNRYQRMR